MAIRIFGDSFSVPFNFNYNLDLRFCVDYLKLCLRNGDIPKDWIELLKETGKEVYTYSIPGTDNLSIFESILRAIPDLNENDIAIFGWTTIERVRSYEKIGNFANQEEVYMSVLMGFENDRHVYEKIKDNAIFFNEWMLYKETHPNSAHELVDWMNIINKLLEHKSIKPIHWIWNPYQFGYNKTGAVSLYEKISVYDRLLNTKGFINLHFGEEGLWNEYDNDAIHWGLHEANFCSYKNSIYYSTGKQVQDCHWDLKGHETFFKIINKEIEKIYNKTE